MTKKDGEANRHRLVRLLSERLEISTEDVIQRFPFIDEIDLSEYDSPDLEAGLCENVLILCSGCQQSFGEIDDFLRQPPFRFER